MTKTTIRTTTTIAMINPMFTAHLRWPGAEGPDPLRRV
jgi:hypothetical protein